MFFALPLTSASRPEDRRLEEAAAVDTSPRIVTFTTPSEPRSARSVVRSPSVGE